MDESPKDRGGKRLNRTVSQDEVNMWYGIIQPALDVFDSTEAKWEEFWESLDEQIKEHNDFWEDEKEGKEKINQGEHQDSLPGPELEEIG